MITFCSDNGPELGAGVAGPFRGYKTHLYEGGIRSSLVAWGPGLINPSKSGHINKASVFSAVDLVPTLLEITGTSPAKNTNYDGEILVDILLGNSNESRQKPILFRRPPDRDAFYGVKDLPDLAVRHGKWKFLCEYDGSQAELYDMKLDRAEKTNVARNHPSIVKKLTKILIDWHKSMPPDNGAKLAKN